MIPCALTSTSKIYVVYSVNGSVFLPLCQILVVSGALWDAQIDSRKLHQRAKPISS